MDVFLSQITQAYDQLQEIHHQMWGIWFRNVLFTWQWWFGVFLTFAPWILWWRVRPRESVSRMLYVMSLVMIIVSWLDFLGSSSLGLWHYNYEVLPLIPSYIPWDFSMIPILVALFIQYKPNFNPLIKAVVFAGVFSYLGEPLFDWLKMYAPEHWRHYYSFLIMSVIYLIAHYSSRAEKFNPL